MATFEDSARACIVRSTARYAAHIDNVRRGKSPLAIHHVRVSLRRVRNALWAFQDLFPRGKYDQWRNHIRAVARLMGRARDLDIHYAFLERFKAFQKHGHYAKEARMMMDLVMKERRKLQPKMRAGIARFAKTKTLASMVKSLRHRSARLSNGAPETMRLTARRKIAERIRKLLSYDSVLRDASRREELHRMRIAAKKLRYTLESFQFLYGVKFNSFITHTAELQGVLGDIHDLDVWIEALPKLCKKVKRSSGIKGLKKEILAYFERQRSERFTALGARWRICAAHKVWERLRSFCA
jgi:CHAD domain-containing protein